MNFMLPEEDKYFGQIEPFTLNSPKLLNDLYSFDLGPSLVSPSSSTSSLSFGFDNSNNFLNVYDSGLQHSTPFWYNTSTNDTTPNFTLSNESLNRKHDVSCGTEFVAEIKPKKESSSLKLPIIDSKRANLIASSISNTSLNMNPNVLPTFVTSSATTLPINSASALNLFKKQSTESFKLIEKIQPKKSRTKYTKQQLEYLEAVFSQNNYPELAQIESLCKTLEISKEKINIWFQNRRARSKRSGSKIKNISPISTSSISLNSSSQSNSHLVTMNSFTASPTASHVISNNSSSFQSTNQSSPSSETFWSNNMSSFVSSVYDL